MHLRDGSQFDLDLGDWPQARAYLLSDYDVDTVRFIAASLSPGGIFLDVGSHIGLISFQVLRRVQSARIYAFEPHPRRYAQFQRNIELNNACDRVTVSAVALSDTDGDVPFDLERHAIADDGTCVAADTVDNFLATEEIDRVDILKVDVEGHELSVVNGADRALRAKRVSRIILEAMDVHGDPTAPAAFLERYRYRRVPLPSSRVADLRTRMGIGRASANAAFAVR